MRIDIGEILRKRVVIFPALEEEPLIIDTEIEVDWGKKGKTKPKKEPPSWGLFPTFTLTAEQFAENLEYRYPVFLYSGSPAEVHAMLDRAINVGREIIDADPWELWLYATAILPIARVKGKPLFEIRLTYIFRAKRVFYAPAERPSGSIVEVPKEPTPEDLEKDEAKKEVKNG